MAEQRHPFWLTPCPARGNVGDLTHRHARDCLEHEPGQCCECGTFINGQAEPDADDDIRNVNEMLGSHMMREAGIVPDLSPVDIEARLAGTDPDDVGIVRELKHATGHAVGKPDGKGRGDLSYRQRLRLIAWKGWVQFLGGDDPT